MKAVVTGAAGFIGSTLSELLLEQGDEVLGVDCLTPYYDASLKRTNLSHFIEHPRFKFAEVDLRSHDPREILRGADAVYHLAAQPGVRLSWAEGFSLYSEHNILVTQRLLEAARQLDLRRFVYASSSSVYGNAAQYPCLEDDIPKPHSPYGVTKLAGEHLCNLYAANWDLPTVSLRYFTVYGPRQRPDMAMNRLIDAVVTGKQFPLYGTGEQVRDFTYVGDVVRATAAAAVAEVPSGTVLNVAGGSEVTMNEVIETLGKVAGQEVRLARMMGQPGDVDRTGGSTERAQKVLGWNPEVNLIDGLSVQFRWQLDRHRNKRSL